MKIIRNPYQAPRNKITGKFLFVLLTTLMILSGPAMAQSVLIPFDDTWNYYDVGDEPASQGSLEWEDTDYNDNLWASGAAQLGYGDGDETTVINSSTSATDSLITAYFRYTFNVTDPAAFADLTVHLLFDDGAVVYLNGTEVWRKNIDGSVNPVVYSTFATQSQDNETDTKTIANTLVAGDNVIAVELHNQAITSSDLSFNLRLDGNSVASSQTYISLGSSWMYSDLGFEPSGWEALGYDDSGWAAGNAQLGYGDGDEATVIGDTVITAYFRRHFTVSDPTKVDSLLLEILYDDGAAVYLNGNLIWLVNLHVDSTDYPHFSDGQANPPDNAVETTKLEATNGMLETGDNVIAVEVHQYSATSSDLSFDLELKAKVSGGSGCPDVLNLTAADSPLSGDYSANQMITVAGDVVTESGTLTTLTAPMVILDPTFSVPQTGELRIVQSGCP